MENTILDLIQLRGPQTTEEILHRLANLGLIVIDPLQARRLTISCLSRMVESGALVRQGIDNIRTYLIPSTPPGLIMAQSVSSTILSLLSACGPQDLDQILYEVRLQCSSIPDSPVEQRGLVIQTLIELVRSHQIEDHEVEGSFVYSSPEDF